MRENVNPNSHAGKISPRSPCLRVSFLPHPSRRLPLPDLAPGTFDAAIESLVNLAETWRRLLADFRPAAQAAEEANAEPPSFGTGGFIPV